MDKIVTSTERRLQAEWDRLHQLAELNPGRLTDISSDDRTFLFKLHEAPVRLAGSPQDPPVSTHDVRVVYPSFFPSTPLEIYVARAFLHPNVHPETGFVCVWIEHRAQNTIEHAIHKLIAMMSGHLYNRETVHTMQPQALDAMSSPNYGKTLIGATHDDHLLRYEEKPRRTRLS
jgi:ubiquitin-protein ligase